MQHILAAVVALSYSIGNLKLIIIYLNIFGLLLDIYHLTLSFRTYSFFCKSLANLFHSLLR